MAVYLDANIYHHAVKNGWADGLSAAARSSRVVVCGSVELLVEVLRCPDKQVRVDLVRTTIAACQRHLSPGLRRITNEVVGEVRPMPS